MTEQLTVGEQYKVLLSQFEKLESTSIAKNSIDYQKQLYVLINKFKTIDRIVHDLDLFSDNEFVEEINVNYLPFLNVYFYLGELYLNGMADDKLQIDISYKAENLEVAKRYFNDYLGTLKNIELLNPLQLKQMEGHNLSREEKIQQYKYQKELSGKVANADSIEDEDDKRQVYLDQISQLIIKSLNHLQLLDMELQVLSNRPSEPKIQEILETKSTKDDDYTTKLETLPQNLPFSKLVNNGKVLQPFTLTRQDLKKKVFGTGQVLPSMTVEEYLDYELANGKMAAPEEPPVNSEDEDNPDEEEEYRKRDWDDWKDDHQKGSGNTMNLG